MIRNSLHTELGTVCTVAVTYCLSLAVFDLAVYVS